MAEDNNGFDKDSGELDTHIENDGAKENAALAGDVENASDITDPISSFEAEADSEAEKRELPRKKKRSALKICLTVLAVLLSIVLLAGIFLFGAFKYYYGMLDYSELFSEEHTWESVELDDEDGEKEESEIDESVDSSMIATEEEKDKFLEQIENVGNADTEKDDSFDVEIKELGGSLGKIERNYVCDYISERDDVINILLIGVDSKKNTNKGQSDTMMVVSICPSEKKIVLTSFLRDTYVMIPGYGGNRLNIAYAAGGPSLLVETIEKNFGLRIDRYATTNFYAFVDVVEKIGTLRIYLTEAELGVINDHIYWTNNIIYKSYDRKKDAIENKGAGYYDLNGIQSLAYARIRRLDTDFGRTTRQRTVMTAIFNEVKKMNPAQWNDLLTTILPMIQTNLTEGDILKLMLNVGAYTKYEIKSISMPPRDRFKYMVIDGKDVIGVDLDYIKSYLKENIY